MANPSSLRALRITLFAACSLPALLTLWWAFRGQLGANPVETLTHHSGEWALRLLLITLAMMPLARISKTQWPIRVRRQLGLWSFFYLLAHFSIFLVFDLSLDFGLLAEEIAERPYITIGFAALLMLTPLAITSTRGWQRRLKRRWKQLHRLIYPAVILACLHFLWKAKVLEAEPVIYALIAALLLCIRLPMIRRAIRI